MFESMRLTCHEVLCYPNKSDVGKLSSAHVPHTGDVCDETEPKVCDRNAQKREEKKRLKNKAFL